MRSARTAHGILIAALIALAKVMPARAQVAAPNPVVAAQDSAYAPRYRFTPVFTNKIMADVSSIGMSNDFRTGLITPWGSIFDFTVSADEKNYRLQNRLDQTKLMRLSDLHTFNTFMNGALSYSDSRVFNRSIQLGGGIQDFVINDKMLTANSTYRRAFRDIALGNFRTDAMGSAGAIASERTFKNDEGIQAGINGGIAYDIGDRITVQGRAAMRETWDQSETVQSTFRDLGSREDSLASALRFQATDSIRFDLTYGRYSGDRHFADQARGSLGGQTGGAEDVFEEHEMRDSRNTTVRMVSQPFSRLTINLTAMHDEQVFDYEIQTTRYSRTVADAVNGNINYRLPWRTTAGLQFENNETLRDLGPQSIASLTDKRKRVALVLSHRFSRTFSVDFNGSSQLQQSFYLDQESNPRDRDQVDTNMNLRITSQPFKKVNAGINVAYTTSEFINIDATQSSNNRTRELWELRPSFTYTVSPRLSIIQVYGLSFEYTDYFFDEDENFLDRNVTFSNEFLYKPVKAVDLRFEYALFLHDSGSYLPDPVTGERLLEVGSEDRRDRTRIRVDYDLTRNIGFFAENLYSRRQEWTPGDFENRDTTTDGQILVGTQANYDWGSGRSLRLLVSRVKRFSPFGAEAEKNYWDARSEFAYPF